MLRFTISKLRASLLAFAGLSLVFLWSCGDDEPGTTDDGPIASFQLEADATNFLQITFTNFSQNATGYSWDFGDGNSSSDESPVHTYAEAGDYTVTLTASNDAGDEATQSQTVSITDPDEALTLLAGTTSKTWKLFREGVSMSVGPSADNPAGWWAGLSNDGTRNCLYEQEFTFERDGGYIFEHNGAMWGEFGVWATDDPNYETCMDAVAANMVNLNGEDVSAWLNSEHTYSFDGIAGTITLEGDGAWIGVPKLSSTGENPTPQSSVTFAFSIEEFTGYDVMTVVFDYGDAGYWPIKYASYSDASLEPALAGAKPSAAFEFSYTEGDQTVSFTNNSSDGMSYSWDFGDGNTSMDESPMHTYAADGIYDVKLIATNENGQDSVTQSVFLNVESITDFLIDHESDVTWNVFGGSEVAIVDNPDQSGINTSAKVLQLTHGFETWAGIITDLGGLLDFTGKTKLKVKLWAPATGTLKYKIEASGGSPSQEIDLAVNTAMEWIELEWDLSTDLNGNAVASDLYSGLVLFPGWNTTTADVYYIDDITME